MLLIFNSFFSQGTIFSNIEYALIGAGSGQILFTIDSQSGDIRSVPGLFTDDGISYIVSNEEIRMCILFTCSSREYNHYFQHYEIYI